MKTKKQNRSQSGTTNQETSLFQKRIKNIAALLMLFIASGFIPLASNAQAPVITSFFPESGAIGSNVTITGTGFNATANQDVVFFGATQATVTAASDTDLTVTVPSGATFQSISVTNLAVNLTAYSAKPFIVTLAGNITFTGQVNFGTGHLPRGTSIGDIDGDGKSDIAVVNYGNSNVSVFRNTSTSGLVSFAAKVDVAAGFTPQAISIGDIDGDGKPDIAVGYDLPNKISVLRNTSTPGTVSFATIVDFTSGSSPRSLSIGDIDGDGKPDIAVANLGSNTVSVFRNTSTSGTISFAAKVDFTTGTEPRSVSIGDIDGDGKPDMAVANSASNTASVFLNTSTPGSVSFAAKVDLTTLLVPLSVIIGDIDGDGIPDMVTSGRNSNALGVWQGASSPGTVSFVNFVSLPTGIWPFAVSIGDINGDGKPDLAVTNSNASSNSVSVIRNTSTSGTISFAGQVQYAAGTFPSSLCIGDIDGDGKPDLVTGNDNGDNISVIRQCTGATVPTLSASSLINCGTQSTTLSIVTGTLNDATSWQWYSGSCGGTSAGTGISITVSPSATTTYYAIGTGGCEPAGSCASITITVNPNPVPSISGNTFFCAGGSPTLDAGTYSGYNWSTGATTQTISVNAAGTFTVTVINASGCSGSTSVATTVNQNPAPSISGTNFLCASGSTTLDAGSYAGYLWSTGATTQTVSVNTSGTYTVTVTNASGCSSSASRMLSHPTALTVDAGPNKIVYRGYPDSSCTKLQSSGVGGGVAPRTLLWSTGSTASFINVCPSTSTVYYLTVTDANGCSKTDSVRVCVIDVRCGSGNTKVTICHKTGSVSNPFQTMCVSLAEAKSHLLGHPGDQLGACGISRICPYPEARLANEEMQYADENETGLTAYPNPTSGEMNISFHSEEGGMYLLRVISVTGQVLLTETKQAAEGENQYTINLKGYAPGIYMVLLQSGDIMRQIRIVKE